MRGAIILLSLVAVAYAAVELVDPSDEGQWLLYKKTHGLIFSSIAEDTQRRVIWQEHVLEINDHSKKFQRGLVSYDREANGYIHLTDREFSEQRNGFKMQSDEEMIRGAASVFQPSKIPLPLEHDWTTASACVSPVKDQGQCGSCWAFASMAALEWAHCMRQEKGFDFAEQMLVDCCGTGILAQILYGVNGCSGGTMTGAFSCVKKQTGNCGTVHYPYIAAEQSCKLVKSNIIGSLSNHIVVTKDEIALQEACFLNGPIPVAIDAGQSSFQTYSSGVYDDENCSSTTVNHAVLLVGWGEENGKKYWKIKNSWGVRWGDKGFFKLARGNNRCGIIGTMNAYPIL